MNLTLVILQLYIPVYHMKKMKTKEIEENGKLLL